MSSKISRSTFQQFIFLLCGFLLLLLCAVYLRESRIAFGEFEKVVHSGDEEAFYNTAKAPLASSKFWFGSRPPVVPLVHKAAGQEGKRIFHWQLRIQQFCSLTLAVTVFLLAGGKLIGLIAASAILALSLAPEVNAWALVIRSESVGFSLLLLLIAVLAAGVYLIRSHARLRYQLLGYNGIAFVLLLLFLTRENWNYSAPLLMILLPLILFGTQLLENRPVTRNHQWAMFLCGLLFLLFFIGASRYSHVLGLYKTNISNVIFIRILPNEQHRLEWNSQYGLPIDSVVMRWEGHPIWDHDREIMKHQPYTDWLQEKGLNSLKRHLLRHPSESLDLVMREFRKSIDDFEGHYTKNAGREPGLSIWLEGRAHIRVWGYGELLLILCLAVGLLVGGLSSKAGTSTLGLVLAISALISATQSALIILADPMEVARHHLPITLLLRYQVVLLITVSILGIGEWLDWILKRRNTTISEKTV
jgi:hypothetical protein